MLKNNFNHGSKWNGKTSEQPTITYKGETKTLTAWAVKLETNAHTLRGKLLFVEREDISWDEAMANKKQRYQFFIQRKKQRRNEKSKQKQVEQDLKKHKHLFTLKALKINAEYFLYKKPTPQNETT